MLGVCSEFERIAKSVIEKFEKDSSRSKRKSHDPSSQTASSASRSATVNMSDRLSNPSSQPLSQSHPPPNMVHTPRPNTANSATPQPSHSIANGHLSPPDEPRPDTPKLQQPYEYFDEPAVVTSHGSANWHNDFTANNTNDFEMASFADMTGFGVNTKYAPSICSWWDAEPAPRHWLPTTNSPG